MSPAGRRTYNRRPFYEGSFHDRSTPGGTPLDTGGRGATTRAHGIQGQGRSDRQKTETLSRRHIRENKLAQKTARRFAFRCAVPLPVFRASSGVRKRRD